MKKAAEQLSDVQQKQIDEEADVAIKKRYYPDEVLHECDYMKRDRDVGCGRQSINQVMAPIDDIYSLLLASQFHPKIVDRSRWETAVEEFSQKSYLKKFKKHHPETRRPVELQQEEADEQTDFLRQPATTINAESD